jgi:hypothetical protein
MFCVLSSNRKIQTEMEIVMATRKTAKITKVAKKAATKKKAPAKVAKKAAKAAMKKPAAKKATAKKATKSVAKKTVAKKNVVKKAAKNAVSKAVTKKIPAKKATAARKAPAKAAPKKSTVSSAPAKRANKPAPRRTTPRQALAVTRKLLEQKQAHDRESQPWQLLDPHHTPVLDPGFQSNEAAEKALELHAAESRMKAIQGSSGTQDRRNQGKRDNR